MTRSKTLNDDDGRDDCGDGGGRDEIRPRESIVIDAAEDPVSRHRRPRRRRRDEEPQLRRANSILSFFRAALEHKKCTLLAALLLIILGIVAATFELESREPRGTPRNSNASQPLQTLKRAKNLLLKIMSTSSLKGRGVGGEEEVNDDDEREEAAAAATTRRLSGGDGGGSTGGSANAYYYFSLQINEVKTIRLYF